MLINRKKRNDKSQEEPFAATMTTGHDILTDRILKQVCVDLKTTAIDLI